MGFNNNIQPERINIAKAYKNMGDSSYFVDNNFQRRLVWTDKQKVRLIETVLIEYPMPEIYLWEQAPDIETGDQRFSIVDGQQRLTSIKQFINNEWPLKASYLDESHRNCNFAGKFWHELSANTKQSLFEYNINTRRIPSSVTEGEIRLIFQRLNETDKSLNPQEMRNATLHGEFLTASAELAESDELQTFKIFTPNQIRRMQDVEFASQLLGFERRGVVGDSAGELNRLYDTYSNEYPNREEDINNVKSSLSLIFNLFESSASIKGALETQLNIYTLHSFLNSGLKLTYDELLKSLTAFAEAYRSSDSNVETDRDLLLFKKGATQRTRSKTSRLDRLNGLKNWINRYLVDEMLS